MFFKDVVGQESVKKRLIHSVQDERISHAQLFSGPAGTGKLAMAIAYAQYISCKNRTKLIRAGFALHATNTRNLPTPIYILYFRFLIPKIKNRLATIFCPQWREMVLKNPYFDLGNWLQFIDAENAQGLIYERESDSIYRKLNLKSFESEFKVMIIWLPEKMHIACSNKLLKLIEEPPNKTLFILITEDEEAVIVNHTISCPTG